MDSGSAAGISASTSQQPLISTPINSTFSTPRMTHDSPNVAVNHSFMSNVNPCGLNLLLRIGMGTTAIFGAMNCVGFTNSSMDPCYFYDTVEIPSEDVFESLHRCMTDKATWVVLSSLLGLSASIPLIPVQKTFIANCNPTNCVIRIRDSLCMATRIAWSGYASYLALQEYKIGLKRGTDDQRSQEGKIWVRDGEWTVFGKWIGLGLLGMVLTETIVTSAALALKYRCGKRCERYVEVEEDVEEGNRSRGVLRGTVQRNTTVDAPTISPTTLAVTTIL